MPINRARPLIMHIDLNSCFAMMEQQANPLIRHKPVAVAAYDTPGGMILASSYEAKAKGIKLGLNVRQGLEIDPGLVVMMPDPDKYFDAHDRLKRLLLKYTSDVVSKSVDEYVVDFRGSPAVRAGMGLEEIGLSIKADVKASLGSYVTVNVGFGTNRFLAKLAAGMNKPDGLTVISADNLRSIYNQVELLDMPGINVRYQARLNLAGIYTSRQFLDASVEELRQIFKSIVGYYWYLRLRGHEIDTVDFGRKSFGQQYALSQKTDDLFELKRLIMKLAEKTGRRLRRYGYSASGIHLSLGFEDHSYYAKSLKGAKLYSTQDIFTAAVRLLEQAPINAKVKQLAVSVYGLSLSYRQLNLFTGTKYDQTSLAQASDIINDRYGEFTLVPALMANMQDTILKRVAFGRVNDE
ncbi:MAG: DNA polymerase Y family protein [Candidatus Saccharimonadales bacterium]